MTLDPTAPAPTGASGEDSSAPTEDDATRGLRPQGVLARPANRLREALRREWSKETAIRRTLVLAITAGFAAYWAAEFAQYHGLPDAVYGGDSYQQLGIIHHLHDGGAVWEDPQLDGEWAFREWLMYAMVAAIARWTPLTVMEADIAWPLVPLVLGGLVAYALGRRLFGRPAYALLLAVAWMGIRPSMMPTSRSFATMLVVPLFWLALASADQRPRGRLLLGAAYGATALSYGVAFFGCTLALLLTWLTRSVHQAWLAWTHSGSAARLHTFLPPALRRQGAWFLPVLGIGLPLAFLFWGPLVLAYAGHVQNPSFVFGDGMRGWGWTRSLAFLMGLFLDVSGPLGFLLSGGALLGIYAAARQWNTHGGRWAALLLAVGLIGTFHYVLTMPLLGTHLIFYHFPQVFLRLAKVLLLFQAVVFLHHQAAMLAGRFELRRAWRMAAAAAPPLLVAALVASAAATTPFDEYQQDWRGLAKRPASPFPEMFRMAEWVKENTPRDATFLSSHEGSFTLNALTGRSVAVERRSHANPFVDLDARHADAAVMLFGHDDDLTQTLLDRYGVDYVYLDPFWVPMLSFQPIQTDPRYSGYWQQAQVRFERGTGYYDPVGTDRQPFDMIRALPQDFGTPLQARFTEVYREPTQYGEILILERTDGPPAAGPAT